MELDTSGFATQGPTVFAGNIGDNRYIVQVSPLGIRLLEGGLVPPGGEGGTSEGHPRVPRDVHPPHPLSFLPRAAVNQLHFIPVDLGSPIVHCAVADPFVVILSAEGQVTMFVLKSDTYGGRTHRLTLQKPPLHHVSAAETPPSGDGSVSPSPCPFSVSLSSAWNRGRVWVGRDLWRSSSPTPWRE